MEVLTPLLDALFPAACAGCGAPAAPAGLCSACRGSARPAPVAPPPGGLDWWVAAFAYEGGLREALARAKYRNARAPLPMLAEALAARLPPGTAASIDVVTWPPTTPARRRQRGFDQAEHLARAVARHLDRPAARLLVRVGGLPQTGRSARERRSGPVLVARLSLPGRRILVVDDVATTGATLAAAARALRDGGARMVAGATVARTPPPRAP